MPTCIRPLCALAEMIAYVGLLYCHRHDCAVWPWYALLVLAIVLGALLERREDDD